MKKLLVVLIPLCLILVACNKPEKKSTSSSSSNHQSDYFVDEVKGDFTQAEVGDGEVSVTESLNDKDIPVVYFNKSEHSAILPIRVKDIDESKTCFFYVDSVLLQEETVKSDADISLPLQNLATAVTIGKHELQVVQYDTNSEDGKVTFLKKISFEIQEK